MILWRAARRLYADLSGTGGLLYSGRWHSQGRPVIYTAEHPALALLEVRVNLDLPPGLAPQDYVLVKIEAPDDAPVTASDVDPRDEDAARRAGDQWLAAAQSLLLKAPSAVAPESFNYLINPLHRDATQVTIIKITPFSFDVRLFR